MRKREGKGYQATVEDRAFLYSSGGESTTSGGKYMIYVQNLSTKGKNVVLSAAVFAY